MKKEEYTLGMYAMYDTIKGEVILIGHANNVSNYVRDTIPALNGKVPLNDLKVIHIGEINPFTGKILNSEENPVMNDWKDCYKFNYENKAEEKKE